MADVLEAIRLAFDNQFSAPFAMIICLWGTLFLEIWKRNNNTLAYMWDCESYEHTEPDRPEFFGTECRPDPITGEMSWIYPQWRRLQKFVLSAAFVSTAIVIVFISVVGVIVNKSLGLLPGNPSSSGHSNLHGAPQRETAQIVARVTYNCIDTLPEAQRGGRLTCLLVSSAIPSIANAASIMLLGKLYQYAAKRLTFWENHRTQSEFNDSLIIKLFAFQFVNTYTSLFYIAFFRAEENGFQKYGVFGWGEQYKDTCNRGDCMSLLSFQVLVLMLLKPVPKFYLDIVWPFLKTVYRALKRRCCAKYREPVTVKRFKNTIAPWCQSQILKRSGTAPRTHPKHQPTGSGHSDRAAAIDTDFLDALDSAASVSAEHSTLLREYTKPDTGDFTLTIYKLRECPLEEYGEKVVQFGYICLFAASFPLAPLLALVLNLIDMRIDARRLLWWNRRPIAFIAADIGMWLPILQFVTYCGVVSNAFIVSYTSGFCDQYFAPQPCTASRRLALTLVFEHFAVIGMYLIRAAVPDVPMHVRLAMRRERYQVTKILEEGVVRKYNTTTSYKKKRKSMSHAPVYRRKKHHDVTSDLSLPNSVNDLNASTSTRKKKKASYKSK